MSDLLEPRSIGTGLARLDGRAKVTGTATYAYEQPVERPAYLHLVQASIARGRVRTVETTASEALDGVLVVLTSGNAARLASTDDEELAVLQSDEVAFRGQIVAAVLAETPEVARHAASLLRLHYDEQPHDVDLRADRDDLYAPDVVNPQFATDTTQGDVDAALGSAAVTVDQTYSTAMYHNNPMEPHTTTAVWDDDGRLTLFDSTQGVHPVRDSLCKVFGLDPERVRVIAPHVGGGFGSKGTVHAHVIAAVLAAQAAPGRAVKLAVTRQQMFCLTGYRTPTIQRVRLGAGADGRLSAITHDVVEQTSKIKSSRSRQPCPPG